MGAIEVNQAAVEAARARWNANDLEGYLQLYDQNAIVHGYPGVEPGIESIRGFYIAFFAAIPGCQLTFPDVFGSGDEVAIRFVLDGVHGGPLMGVPATGKTVRMHGITILKFVDGRCVERWAQADFLGLLQQIGAIPGPS